MIFNFKKETINLDGTVYTDNGKEDGRKILMSEILSIELAKRAEPIEAIKAAEWALELNAKGEINLDSSDLEKLKSFVKQCNSFTNLLKYRIIKTIEATELEEASKKSK